MEIRSITWNHNRQTKVMATGWIVRCTVISSILFFLLVNWGSFGLAQGRRSPSLQRSYTLTPRYLMGQKSAYRFVNVQFFLEGGQGVVSRAQLSGDFNREVVEVRRDGSAVERITWRNFSIANGEGRSGPLERPEEYPWAKDFTYLFSAEDSHEDFHWDYQDIPRTTAGDRFMMHTINAHFEFDFLRSRAHGGIDKLHRPGDYVGVPDSDHPFEIRLRAAPLTFVVIKRDHTMTFKGLTPCGNRTCAVLTFWTWVDVTVRFSGPPEVQELPGFTQFDGHLLLDVEDGSLHSGFFKEWVTLPAPGPAGVEYQRVYVEYGINRLATVGDDSQPSGGRAREVRLPGHQPTPFVRTAIQTPDFIPPTANPRVSPVTDRLSEKKE